MRACQNQSLWVMRVRWLVFPKPWLPPRQSPKWVKGSWWGLR